MYNKLLNISDIIYNNSENIHKKLFNDAIDKYCIDKSINKEDYKIIDQKNKDNDLLPSTAIFIDQDNLEYIDLTQYWNNNYVNSLYLLDENNVFKELLIDDENKKYIEIIYIDYVKGKVQFKNKFNNKCFFVKFNKLNQNKQYNLKLENTFTTLYYGN